MLIVDSSDFRLSAHAWLASLILFGMAFSFVPARAASVGRPCEIQFSKSSPLVRFQREGFRTIDFSSPVRQQVGDTCWLEASVSQLESAIKAPLSMDYYRFKVLEDLAASVSEAWVDPRHDRLGAMTMFQPRGTYQGSAADYLFSLGLVPEGEYRISEELALDLRNQYPTARATNLNSGRSWLLGPIALLDFAISDLVDSGLNRRASGADRNELRSLEGLQILRLLQRAGPLNSTQSLHSQNELITRRQRKFFNEITGHSLSKLVYEVSLSSVRSFSEPSKSLHQRQVIEQVKANIDQGISVGFSFVEPLSSDGDRRSNIDFSSVSDSGSIDRSFTHALVIEGYRLDPLGSVSQFLLKDSHGSDSYLDGYRLISIEAFFQLGETLEFLYPET